MGQLGNRDDTGTDRIRDLVQNQLVQKVCAARAHELIKRLHILVSAHLDASAGCSRLLDMARGNIKVGDEVAVTAIVRGRVIPIA
ncbi:hypothetical protein X729_31820 [Mesorhizobium sp. L103C131B0]|nr:hypothetical protein X729_31820 [Mesorhizobium sp. L103C131B0]